MEDGVLLTGHSQDLLCSAQSWDSIHVVESVSEESTQQTKESFIISWAQSMRITSGREPRIGGIAWPAARSLGCCTLGVWHLGMRGGCVLHRAAQEDSGVLLLLRRTVLSHVVFELDCNHPVFSFLPSDTLASGALQTLEGPGPPRLADS